MSRQRDLKVTGSTRWRLTCSILGTAKRRQRTLHRESGRNRTRKGSGPKRLRNKGRVRLTRGRSQQCLASTVSHSCHQECATWVCKRSRIQPDAAQSLRSAASHNTSSATGSSGRTTKKCKHIATSSPINRRPRQALTRRRSRSNSVQARHLPRQPALK